MLDKLPYLSVQRSHQLMVAIVAVLGVFSLFWGEKVPAGGGLGWDGITYAGLVRNYPSMIINGQLSSYYAHRILPSVFVRGILDLSSAVRDDVNIIRAFELYNLVLLLVACGLWKNISDHLSLTLLGRWLGFSGLFLSFEGSKQAFYYPVLTDVTALVIGLMLLSSFLQKKRTVLFIVSIAGAFVWPGAGISGAILWVGLDANFRKFSTGDNRSARGEARKKRFYYAISAIGLIFLLSVVGYLVLTRANVAIEHPYPMPRWWISALPAGTPPGTYEQLLTGIPSSIIVLIGWALLIGSSDFLRSVFLSFCKISLFTALGAMGIVAIPVILIHFLSNPTAENPSNIIYIVNLIIFPPSGKFLLPFVSLSSLWGPVVLLVIVYWRDFCVQANRLGPGVVAIVGFAMLLGLANEPRFMTSAWPFFVAIAAATMDKVLLKKSFRYGFLALVIIYSQFWLKINVVKWSPPDWANLQEFPKEIYFMHYGLWMNWTAYVMQLLVSMLSAMWLSTQELVRRGQS